MFCYLLPAGLKATPARWQGMINTCSSSSARRGSHMSWRLFLPLSPPAPSVLHSKCSKTCIFLLSCHYWLKHWHFIGWARALRMGRTPWVTSVAGRPSSTSSPHSTSPLGLTMTSVQQGLMSSAESPASTGSVAHTTCMLYWLILCVDNQSSKENSFLQRLSFLRWLMQSTAACSQLWEKSSTLLGQSCGTPLTKR